MIVFRQGSRYPVFFGMVICRGGRGGGGTSDACKKFASPQGLALQSRTHLAYCWAKAVHHSKMGCLCRSWVIRVDITRSALSSAIDNSRYY